MPVGDIHGSQMIIRAKDGSDTTFELVRVGTLRELKTVQEANQSKTTELLKLGDELEEAQAALARKTEWSAEQSELYDKMKHDLAEARESCDIHESESERRRVRGNEFESALIDTRVDLAKEKESVARYHKERVASSRLLMSLLGGFKDNGTILDQILASAEKDLEIDDHREDAVIYTQFPKDV